MASSESFDTPPRPEKGQEPTPAEGRKRAGLGPSAGERPLTPIPDNEWVYFLGKLIPLLLVAALIALLLIGAEYLGLVTQANTNEQTQAAQHIFHDFSQQL